MNLKHQPFKALSKRSFMIKSQPNIFKTKRSNTLFTTNHKEKPKFNLKQFQIAIKDDKCTQSPLNCIKLTRPSSLLSTKKSIEDYYSTNTASTSRKPMRSPNICHQKLGITLCDRKLGTRTSIKSTTVFAKSFTKTYERFNQHKLNSENRLNTLKQQVIEKENRQYRNIPLINQKSKTLCSSSEDFLSRMKKNEEGLALKKEKMIRVKIRKESEELSRKYRRDNRENDSMNLSLTERIQNLYDWDKKRKNKIEEMKEQSIKKELRTVSSRPNINTIPKQKNTKTRFSKGKKLKTNTDRVTKRLYKDDPIKIKAKKDILIKVFEPTFAPKVNASRNNHSNLSLHHSKEIELKYLSANFEALLREKIFNNINKTYTNY